MKIFCKFIGLEEEGVAFEVNEEFPVSRAQSMPTGCVAVILFQKGREKNSMI